MKDFTDILQEGQQPQKMRPLHHEKINKLEDKGFRIDWEHAKDRVIKIISPFMVALVTTPFTTASMLLQISDRPVVDPLAKKLELVKNVKGQVQSYVKIGIFGDNKIFRPAQYRGYADCLRQMGKQGIKGLYKGAFTGIIFSVANTKIRAFLYKKTIQLTNQQEIWKKNIYTILTCTLADLLTLPIMLCQSRLVFQDSTDNFRTYKTPINIFKDVGLTKLWAGGSILLFKNILFSYSWLSFFKQSPFYSFIFSTLLSHITVYPFMTIIRQLQCNHPGTPMMHQRGQKIREVITRIWKTQKFLGFYRGFFGYSLVHSFLGFIMIESSMRTGYFQQLQG